MSVRSAAAAASRDPLVAANSDPPSASTSIQLPGLRTRSVVLDHSLQAQWRGTAGRAHTSAAYVSDSQRLWILLSLFLLAALLVVCSLHFSEPTEQHMHPVARLPPEHPHSLNKAAAAAAAMAAAAAQGSQLVAASSSLAVSEYSVIYVTVPSAAVGTSLATGLLESKLVACANLVPALTSMYWWEGKIQTDQEQLLMVSCTHTINARHASRRMQAGARRRTEAHRCVRVCVCLLCSSRLAARCFPPWPRS